MEQQDSGGGVATAAKDQAAQVGQTAAQAGGQVARTTKDQAANVVGEATQQARDFIGEARTQVGEQAGVQKGRAVEGLRSLGDELHQMAGQSDRSGLAADVARQAASRAHGLADHLDRHEPIDLLEQVRAYARRRPAVFLTGAAVLGVLAGRLTRSGASDARLQVPDGGPATAPPDAAYETNSLTTEAAYETNSLTSDTGTSTYPAEGLTTAAGQGYAEPGGGFGSVGEPDPAYQPAPGYDGGVRPQSPYDGGVDDPAWRHQ